jgi:hypothetical protein
MKPSNADPVGVRDRREPIEFKELVYLATKTQEEAQGAGRGEYFQHLRNQARGFLAKALLPGGSPAKR